MSSGNVNAFAASKFNAAAGPCAPTAIVAATSVDSTTDINRVIVMSLTVSRGADKPRATQPVEAQRGADKPRATKPVEASARRGARFRRSQDELLHAPRFDLTE